jgi:CubicO group peptidase (beta-lactamase class C family)
MKDVRPKVPSRRARIILYLVGIAAMAVPWGYLLFVRPWLRASRSPVVPRASIVAILAPLTLALPAATAPPSDPALPVTGAGSPDADVAAFVDAFFSRNLPAYHAPGAAVIVVKDGQVLLSRGYGYADLDRRAPFDPDRTVIRAKSVSKLFTATAAMQLVERGQIELHNDINTYLTGYQVPASHLMRASLSPLAEKRISASSR